MPFREIFLMDGSFDMNDFTAYCDANRGNINTPCDITGDTPLIIACDRSSEDSFLAHARHAIINCLIEKGADVHYYNPHRKDTRPTPLMTAINTGADEAVTLLLEHGANPLIPNTKGDNPARQAKEVEDGTGDKDIYNIIEWYVLKNIRTYQEGLHTFIRQQVPGASRTV